jgi:hypothetical protein
MVEVVVLEREVGFFFRSNRARDAYVIGDETALQSVLRSLRSRRLVLEGREREGAWSGKNEVERESSSLSLLLLGVFKTSARALLETHHTNTHTHTHTAHMRAPATQTPLTRTTTQSSQQDRERDSVARTALEAPLRPPARLSLFSPSLLPRAQRRADAPPST